VEGNFSLCNGYALTFDYSAHQTDGGAYMIEHVRELSSGKQRASGPLSSYSYHPDHLQNKVYFSVKYYNKMENP